ncbi:MAG: 30S ribosome-binding factor RbfA [Holosporaceae bacterium]|nr:MAG: 30S ribosome-binding factor RbfA [Holosporaceae bacterium]
MHKEPTQRGLKVAEEVRRMLVDIFRESPLWEQGLAEVSLTLTEVRISADLRNAHVFVLPLESTLSGDLLLKKLEKAVPRLRKELAKKSHLRVVPALTFHLDNAFDNFNQIDSLLNDPKIKRDIKKSDT